MTWVRIPPEDMAIFSDFSTVSHSHFEYGKLNIFKDQYSYSGWNLAEFGWRNTINELCNYFTILYVLLIKTFSNNSKTPGWTLKIFYWCDSMIKLQAKMALKNSQNKVLISASVLRRVSNKFPTNNLNFHWRWLDQIQDIFLNLFYFYTVSTYMVFDLFRYEVLWKWDQNTFSLVEALKDIFYNILGEIFTHDQKGRVSHPKAFSR